MALPPLTLKAVARPASVAANKRNIYADVGSIFDRALDSFGKVGQDITDNKARVFGEGSTDRSLALEEQFKSYGSAEEAREALPAIRQSILDDETLTDADRKTLLAKADQNPDDIFARNKTLRDQEVELRNVRDKPRIEEFNQALLQAPITDERTGERDYTGAAELLEGIEGDKTPFLRQLKQATRTDQADRQAEINFANSLVDQNDREQKRATNDYINGKMLKQDTDGGFLYTEDELRQEVLQKYPNANMANINAAIEEAGKGVRATQKATATRRLKAEEDIQTYILKSGIDTDAKFNSPEAIAKSMEFFQDTDFFTKDAKIAAGEAYNEALAKGYGNKAVHMAMLAARADGDEFSRKHFDQSLSYYGNGGTTQTAAQAQQQVTNDAVLVTKKAELAKKKEERAKKQDRAQKDDAILRGIVGENSGDPANHGVLGSVDLTALTGKKYTPKQARDLGQALRKVRAYSITNGERARSTGVFGLGGAKPTVKDFRSVLDYPGITSEEKDQIAEVFKSALKVETRKAANPRSKDAIIESILDRYR